MEQIVLWSPRMYDLVGKMTSNFGGQWYLEHDDLLQEVYVSILKIKNDPVDIGLFVQIVRHSFLAYARRNRRQQFRISLSVHTERAVYGNFDLRLDMAAALEAITPKERKAIEAQYMQSMTVTETADSLGIKYAGIVSRNKRACKTLRVVLADYSPK